MRDELGAGFARDAPRATEMVGVRVGHDDGVHVLQAEVGGREPMLQRLPGLRARETGIDDGETAVVDQAVHVDVAESRHPDRQLHAQHARRDLGDLGRRGLLFLSGFARPRLRVGHERQGIPAQPTKEFPYSAPSSPSATTPSRLDAIEIVTGGPARVPPRDLHPDQPLLYVWYQAPFPTPRT